MTITSRCANCGAELADNAIDGLCPRCLLRLALAPPGETGAATGEIFGPYRTIRVLGEGGMGIVYLAGQDQPIHRLVALKVIKLGMDTEEVIARFESERQALAMMDHPGIARVYDAGATPEGRPYFVMEYVEGVPITKYCDERRLTVRERLGLFVQVCNAVQHAHQKGIIHRDLKPSNVLVRRSEGLAIPTIIDFGLAKVLGPSLTGHTLYTQLGVLMGTPEYMSPEQAAGSHAVDTRTDVYSLGLLLYELLAGALPFNSQKLRRAAIDEMCRVIQQEEPPTPVHRLASLGSAARTVAESRRVNVATLVRQLRGELHWIAFKALEKDPAHRYASVSELSADVMRHLRDEPVSAGPQRAAYRLRKLIRRHRTAAMTAAAVATCLVAATIGATWLYARAERAWASAAREQYKAAINAAALQIQMEEPTEARQQLLTCEPALRGWEWRHLFYRTDPTIAVWKAAGPIAKSPYASDFAFAADGRVLWRTPTSVEEWLAAGRHGRSLAGAGEMLALDENGRFVASRDADGRIGIAQIDSTQAAVALNPGQRTIRAAAFDPSGQHLAAGSEDGWLQVWRISPPTLQFEIPAHKGRIASVRFIAPGNRIGTAGNDNRVRIWDAAEGKAISTINDQAASPWVIAFTRDGKWLAFASREGMVPAEDVRIRVYETASGRLIRSYPCEPGITAIAFSQTPHGRELAFVSDTGELQLCSEAVGCAVVKRKTNDPLNSLAYSPDASLIYTGSESGEVAVWANATHTGTFLPLPAGNPRSFAMHPSGRWAVGSVENEVHVWSAHNGLMVENWSGHTARVNAVAVGPDGSRFASASDDRTARIWDPQGKTIAVLSGHSAPVMAIAFSRDGAMVATGSADCTARLWDAATGRPLAVFQHNAPVNSLAFNPDGQTLATGSGDLAGSAGGAPAIYEWDLARRSLARSFAFPDGQSGSAVSAIAFSPDGSRLLAARVADATIWVFDVHSTRVVAKLAGHRRPIPSMVFSPDGSRLASGSLDQTVRIWDGHDYAPLLELVGQNGDIYNVTFLPDGSRLYSAGYGVRIWDTRGRLPCTPDHPCCCPNPWPRLATSLGIAGAGRAGL